MNGARPKVLISKTFWDSSDSLAWDPLTGSYIARCPLFFWGSYMTRCPSFPNSFSYGVFANIGSGAVLGRLPNHGFRKVPGKVPNHGFREGSGTGSGAVGDNTWAYFFLENGLGHACLFWSKTSKHTHKHGALLDSAGSCFFCLKIFFRIFGCFQK